MVNVILGLAVLRYEMKGIQFKKCYVQLQSRSDIKNKWWAEIGEITFASIMLHERQTWADVTELKEVPQIN